MKRTPIKRKSPLKTKTGLSQSSSLKRSPAKRVVKIDHAWREAREVALVRDGYACRAFGVAGLDCFGRLHVHHVLPRSRGGKHNPENLLSLCSRHHEWAHGHPADAKPLGLIK